MIKKLKPIKKSDLFAEYYFSGNLFGAGIESGYKEEDYYPGRLDLAKKLKKHFNPTKVLDIGCAKGFLVKAFHDLGVQAEGTDISEYAIKLAPKQVRKNLHIVDSDLEPLPFPNNSFDLIICMGTLEYMKNHKHAIKEIKRVLQPKGGVYIITLYKKHKDDTVRVNVHSKEYWKREFKKFTS